MLSDVSPISAFSAGLFIGAGLLLAVAWLFRRRAAEAEGERARLEAVAVKAREILAGSPDGLFIWDRGSGAVTCSRKLASLLALADGVNTRFEDVAARFEETSGRRLEAAVRFLTEEGRRFELVLATADSGGRRFIQAVGARAATKKGDVLADMVWMRDISAAAKLLVDLTGETDLPEARDLHLRGLLDAFPFPVWLRDGDMKVVFTNHAALSQRVAGPDMDQAVTARAEGRPVTRVQDLEDAGEIRPFDVTECPIGDGDAGDDDAAKTPTGVIGYAFPHSAEGAPPAPPPAPDPVALPPGEEMTASVLRGLATGVAIFGRNSELLFFNEAYRDMWRLDPEWLSGARDFGEILEHLRADRRLPEVPDFRAYKMEQLSQFDDATGDPSGDLMHLPDGRTLRAVTYPMPGGGLAFGYDDVTDQLDLESAVNARDAVHRATIENLREAIAVFGSDGRLKLWNPAFASLWDPQGGALGPDVHVADFVEATRAYAAPDGDWESKRGRIMAAMTRRETSRARIERSDGRVLEYVNTPLPDGGVLVSYADVTGLPVPPVPAPEPAESGTA